MNVAAILKHKGREVATAEAATDLNEIVQILVAKRIGAVVVVDDEDQPIGIISERDIIRVLAENAEHSLSKTAGEVMFDKIATCTESDTIVELMARMTELRHRHLPVVADGRLTGIISIGDVVKNHIAEVEMEASALRSYISTG